MANDDMMSVGITTDVLEDVLLADPTRVEALRAGKQATFWLTDDAAHIAAGRVRVQRLRGR